MRRIVCAACVSVACNQPAESIDFVPFAIAVEVPPLGPCDPELLRPAPVRGVPLQKERAVGSTVALARFGKRSVAYVADEDARQVRVVDLDDQNEIASVDLGGRPAQLVMAPDGRIYAALRDASELWVLEPASRDPDDGLRALCRIETPAEPVGLALTSGLLLVASRWGQSLSGYTLTNMRRRFTTPLPRDPHGVAVTTDGLAYVSHVSGGHVSIVDPRKPDRPRVVAVNQGSRIGGQGFAVAAAGEQVLLPMVLTDPGDTKVEAEISGYGSSPSGVALPAVARVPAREQDAEILITRFRRFECLLPRAALWDARDDALLLACMGENAVAYRDVRRGFDFEMLRVAAGPTGLALDLEENRLVVWSQFDAVVSIADLSGSAFDRRLESAAEPQAIQLEPRGAPAALEARGRELFHAAGDRRLSADGRACASCHPSGRDDGLTWATLEGPRQTPMLIGRLADTAPYDWNGAKPDLHAHLRRTLRRLAGNGLTARERQALFAYVGTLAPPRVHQTPTDTVKLGAQLFAEQSTGCADCHLGAPLTDGLRHELGTVARGDKLTDFDTPSLRFVAQSAPYFHDGRYPTLLAMLKDEQLHMGNTSQLSDRELEALVAYLRTL